MLEDNICEDYGKDHTKQKESIRWIYPDFTTSNYEQDYRRFYDQFQRMIINHVWQNTMATRRTEVVTNGV